MAPVPTEILDGDIKELKVDIREIRSDLHRIDNGLTRLQAEFGLAKWLLGLMLVSTLSGIGAGIWWASGINTRVGGLESRFDRLEASIARVIEQTKPAAGGKIE